jgi:hypothetical protein
VLKIKPRHLIVLFPRTWRARYGVEFEAMLEASDLTPHDVRNILWYAIRERVATTMTGRVVLGTFLSSLATLVALGLATLAPAGVVAGHQLWTIELSVPFGLVMTAMSLRFAWCVYTGTRIGGREQVLWIAWMSVVSVLAQWGQMVGWRDGMSPGVPVIWALAAIFMTTDCVNTLAMSRILPHGQAPSRLRQRPPARPLGLA